MDVQEIVLPTWKEGEQLQFDCRNNLCKITAEKLLESCDHGLRICHQTIGVNRFGIYQIVLQHGGEAVYILPTGENNMIGYLSDMIDWIDAVHKYQGLA